MMTDEKLRKVLIFCRRRAGGYGNPFRFDAVFVDAVKDAFAEEMQALKKDEDAPPVPRPKHVRDALFARRCINQEEDRIHFMETGKKFAETGNLSPLAPEESQELVSDDTDIVVSKPESLQDSLVESASVEPDEKRQRETAQLVLPQVAEVEMEVMKRLADVHSSLGELLDNRQAYLRVLRHNEEQAEQLWQQVKQLNQELALVKARNRE